MTIQTLMMNQITIDEGLQTRVAIHEATVKEYQEAIETAHELPPVTVFHDGQNYYLADGWHRLQAHKNLGRDRINAKIQSGSHKDAFLHALSANADHGLRRSQADRRRAVQMALEDKDIGKRSNREIAKLCKVSHTFVNSTRESLKPKQAVQSLASKPSNWPEPSSKVETFPHELPDQDILHESYTEQDEALDTMTALAEENERLNDRLAIKAMDATEEEKALAAETINTLRAELKLITVERDSLKVSRNTYQKENADLKRQCAKYVAVIKKLNEQLEGREADLEFYRAVEGGGSHTTNPSTHPTTAPGF